MSIEEIQCFREIVFAEGRDHFGTDGEHLIAREVIEHHGHEFKQSIEPLALGQRIDVLPDCLQKSSHLGICFHAPHRCRNGTMRKAPADIFGDSRVCAAPTGGVFDASHPPACRLRVRFALVAVSIQL